MNSRKNIPETGSVKSVNRRDSGFSLVETVVALLVLTVGLLGMATLAIYVMKGNKSSNQISTATALAQDKMEKLRGLGYEGLPSSNSTVTENYGSIRINEDEAPPPEFYPYKRVVVTKVDDPVQFMKTVTVAVSWVSDKEHSVKNTMIISR